MKATDYAQKIPKLLQKKYRTSIDPGLGYL